MKAMNVNALQMNEALSLVNDKYKGNIVWKRFDREGSGFQFTLTVKSSRGLGARRGTYVSPRSKEGLPKRIAAACWHVHGDFFDALLSIAPDAVIRSGFDPETGRKLRIDRNGGNWQDRNIGSQCSPCMYSDACDCDNDDRRFAPQERVAVSA